jgi:O-antigen ligase
VSPLATAFIALGALSALGVGVSRPTRTIIPLYAAVVPIGGVFGIPVPLPVPFNSLSSLIGGLALLATVMHILLYGRARIPSLPVAVWFVLLSWFAMTAFWAQLPSAAVEELSIALPLVLLMAAVGILPSDAGDVTAVRIAIVLGGAVIGAYALMLLVTGAALPIHGTAQRFSIAADPSQTNPNQLAAALILPFLFSLDLVLRGEGPRLRVGTWKVLGSVNALLLGVALIMTGSRGGAIATATGLLLILVFAWRWHPDLRRSVVRLVAGAVLVVAAIGFASFIAIKLSPEGRWADVTSIDAVQRLSSPEAGTSGRAEIWTTGYAACQRFCALGAGLGNFPTVFTDLFATTGAGRNVGLARPGHNLYFEIAVETGFVGLTLLLFALASEWLALRSTGHLAPALGAALVALLVVDAFESFIWFKYFWLLFMVIRLAEGHATLRQTLAIPLAKTDELTRVDRSLRR